MLIERLTEDYRRSRSSDSITAFEKRKVIGERLSAALEVDQPSQESAIPAEASKSYLTPLTGCVETQSRRLIRHSRKSASDCAADGEGVSKTLSSRARNPRAPQVVRNPSVANNRRGEPVTISAPFSRRQDPLTFGAVIHRSSIGLPIAPSC